MTAALEGGEWSAACPSRTLPPGKTRYPFYRRLGGPQGRSGQAENLVPTEIRSPDRPALNKSSPNKNKFLPFLEGPRKAAPLPPMFPKTGPLWKGIPITRALLYISFTFPSYGALPPGSPHRVSTEKEMLHLQSPPTSLKVPGK